jgi:hypothetical protein
MSEGSANSGFFCDLAALGAIERQRRHELAAVMARAIQKPTELSNGYALTLDARKITAATLDEWIGLEQRCCPFLNFKVRTSPLSDQLLTFEVTGADGVKEFLRAQFSR